MAQLRVKRGELDRAVREVAAVCIKSPVPNICPPIARRLRRGLIAKSRAIRIV